MFDRFLSWGALMTVLLFSVNAEETKVEGTPFMGQKSAMDSKVDKDYVHRNVLWLVDDLDTDADTWNINNQSDNFSYAGLRFDTALEKAVTKLTIKMALHFDGGWFGKESPGVGEPLTEENLVTPIVQVTLDGESWTKVEVETNYTEALVGQKLGLRLHKPVVTPEVYF